MGCDEARGTRHTGVVSAAPYAVVLEARRCLLGLDLNEMPNAGKSAVICMDAVRGVVRILRTKDEPMTARSALRAFRADALPGLPPA